MRTGIATKLTSPTPRLPLSTPRLEPRDSLCASMRASWSLWLTSFARLQYLSTAKSYFQHGFGKNSKSKTLRDAPDRPNKVWTRKDQLVARRQDSEKEIESELARERARERIREWRQHDDRVVNADWKVLSDSASEVSRQEGLERRFQLEETKGLRRQVSIALF